MAFTCVPAATSASTTKVNHHVCTCQSCRNTGHDQRREFSNGAKIKSIAVESLATTSFSAESDDSEKELLFHQKPNLVSLMCLVLKNQRNITDNNDINYVDSSQLPKNVTGDTTSNTIEKHRRVINVGTNYEKTFTTHDSNNYLDDHEVTSEDNVKRVWKMQQPSRSNIFVSLRVNTFLLVFVSTIFLLTISSGVHAGPINATQTTALTDFTTERVSKSFSPFLLIYFFWLWTIRISHKPIGDFGTFFSIFTFRIII